MSNSTNLRTREAALYQTTKNCYEKAKESLVATAQFKKSIKLLTEGSEEYDTAIEILEMELDKVKYYLRQYKKYKKEWNELNKASQFSHNTTELDEILLQGKKDSQS